MNDEQRLELEKKLAKETDPEANKRLETAVRQAQAASSDADANAWDYDNADKLQAMIDDGKAWHMEGSIGRAAMDALEAGVCFLPIAGHRDYYGNLVPARTMLKPGTKGTLENAARYWHVKVQ